MRSTTLRSRSTTLRVGSFSPSLPPRLSHRRPQHPVHSSAEKSLEEQPPRSRGCRSSSRSSDDMSWSGEKSREKRFDASRRMPRGEEVKSKSRFALSSFRQQAGAATPGPKKRRTLSLPPPPLPLSLSTIRIPVARHSFPDFTFVCKTKRGKKSQRSITAAAGHRGPAASRGPGR